MIGFGYDSHRFKDEGQLIIGGLIISDKIGVHAHSDGDVVIHSLIDALLGACGLGDIGELFPDNNSDFKGIDSKLLLIRTIEIIEIKKFKIVNIDITILLEKIKIKDYKNSMAKVLSEICKISIEKVNVKAKTNELMGFIGRNEGLASFCVCQVESIA